MKRAFTLIELLIVVAIIAILAAIAVPNFLEAQVRSKISRVKAELRTFATGIEAYAVDYNKAPPELNFAWYGSQLPNPATNTLVPVSGLHSDWLSTPVSYLTQARTIDVFQDKNLIADLDEQYYTYQDMRVRKEKASLPFFKVAPVFYGAWRMCSVGPDRSFAHTGSNAQLAYDSSNGTISTGNIWRSQMNSDNAQPVAGKTYVDGTDSVILLP